MKSKRSVMTEEEIDQKVIAQADDVSAWESPAKVRKSKSTSVTLPSELASRAAFFARLHREGSLDNWLNVLFKKD